MSRAPSIVGCAAVQWQSGSSLSIRVFYVSTNQELIMCTLDKPDLNVQNNPAWQYTTPKINGQSIAIPVQFRNGITAVSVHPNTERHEIHVFFVKDGVLQSAIFAVKNQTWFMDSELPKLKIGDTPSAAIGWEDGSKNQFRLYLINSVYQGGGDWTDVAQGEGVVTYHDASIREVAFGNGKWYMGNDNKPLDTFGYEIPSVEGKGPGVPTQADPRVAACTWLDGSNQRQLRVYYIFEVKREYKMPATVGIVAPAPGNIYISRSIVELIYKNDMNYWVRTGGYGEGYFGDRSIPLFALPIKSSNGVGIRHYGYNRGDNGESKDAMTFSELGWDQSSANWYHNRLPFNLEDLESKSWDNPGVTVPFSGVAWNWPDTSQVSIRLYRVAFRNLDKSQGYICETSFDTSAGSWTRTTAKF